MYQQLIHSIMKLFDCLNCNCTFSTVAILCVSSLSSSSMGSSFDKKNKIFARTVCTCYSRLCNQKYREKTHKYMYVYINILTYFWILLYPHWKYSDNIWGKWILIHIMYISLLKWYFIIIPLQSDVFYLLVRSDATSVNLHIEN